MRKTVLDIPIDWISYEEAIRKIAQFVLTDKPHQITTINPEFIVESQKNSEFKKVLQNSDLSLADGTGIVLTQRLNDRLGSKPTFLRFLGYLLLGFEYLLSANLNQDRRITGVALTEKIMHRAQTDGWRIYLLGAQPGVATQAAKIWQDRYQGLQIVGASADNPNDPDTITNIKAKKPDILFVAYGAPKQDLFIAKHKETLKVPVMIGVGGTFDTLVGTKYNPPRWVKSLGLEWLAYLIRYPKRWKRIWNATIVFSWLAVKRPK